MSASVPSTHQVFMPRGHSTLKEIFTTLTSVMSLTHCRGHFLTAFSPSQLGNDTENTREGPLLNVESSVFYRPGPPMPGMRSSSANARACGMTGTPAILSIIHTTSPPLLRLPLSTWEGDLGSFVSQLHSDCRPIV